ncbi:MAG TPA: hypothetical protein VI168_10630 [Croceibacterium sp.]
MARRFNRRQALENQAFLAALRRTGNARLAARELGVHRATYTKRRTAHPAFAAEWDAALALAHARLNNPPRARSGRGTAGAAGGGGVPAAGRNMAPEPGLVRLANGRLQLRAPAPGVRRIDRAARQAFLAALGATANVRLAARAAGFAHSSFYRLRDHDPAFAREMRLALERGYERIELALLASFDPDSCRDDAWRHNDPPEIPSMTAAEALQLLHLHHKEARLWDERPDRRRRRGETTDRYSARLGRKWRAEKAWDREGYEVARAARDGGQAPAHLEPPAPLLPALEQVTGWSKAKPGAAERRKAGRPALFGGWRIGDWEGG